jgi:acylphosphatase
MPARHFKIVGDVQGVGFRYSMLSQARRLRLVGWVRNCRDGSVEAVAIGDPPALDQLTEWTQRGPPGANVRQVQTRAATDTEVADVSESFNQLPSV